MQTNTTIRFTSTGLYINGRKANVDGQKPERVSRDLAAMVKAALLRQKRQNETN